MATEIRIRLPKHLKDRAIDNAKKSKLSLSSYVRIILENSGVIDISVKQKIKIETNKDKNDSDAVDFILDNY